VEFSSIGEITAPVCPHRTFVSQPKYIQFVLGLRRRIYRRIRRNAGYRQVRSSSVIRAFFYQRQMAINIATITTALTA